MHDPAIEVEGLVKRFGDTEALRGLDLHVPAGTVCGMLGPNGAGKSTALRILTTLSLSDGGRATVAGCDVVAEAQLLRSRIGLVGQHISVDNKLSGRENLRMIARLYHLSPRARRTRVEELLEQFQLTEAADRKASGYSGGMRRRLDLAASLMVAPAVLFLDEPTTGLDPRSRSAIWQTVKELAAAGTTVLLTTQYLDEADQLADDIVVIDTGHVVARGTPTELKAQLGSQLELTVREVDEIDPAAAALGTELEADPTINRDERRITVPVDSFVGFADLVRKLDRCQVDAQDITLRRPTLDEVFLRITDRESARV